MKCCVCLCVLMSLTFAFSCAGILLNSETLGHSASQRYFTRSTHPLDKMSRPRRVNHLLSGITQSCSSTSTRTSHTHTNTHPYTFTHTHTIQWIFIASCRRFGILPNLGKYVCLYVSVCKEGVYLNSVFGVFSVFLRHFWRTCVKRTTVFLGL